MKSLLKNITLSNFFSDDLSAFKNPIRFSLKLFATLAFVMQAPVLVKTDRLGAGGFELSEMAAFGGPDGSTIVQRSELDSLCIDPTSELCKQAQAATLERLKSSSNSCAPIRTATQEAVSKLNKACSDSRSGSGLSCRQKIGSCLDQEDSYTSGSDGTYDLENEPCDGALANRCPGLDIWSNARSFVEDRKDAERDIKDAKQTIDGYMKDQSDANLDYTKSISQLRRDQAQKLTEFNKQGRDISQALKDAFEKLSDNKSKAMEDAQAALQALMDAQDKIKFDAANAMRKVQDDIAAATEELNTTCRGYAAKKFEASEAERKAKLAAFANKRNVGSSTQMAASTKRAQNALSQTRAKDYSSLYEECMSGTAPEGAAARAKISAAQRAFASTDAAVKDQLKMQGDALERQRRMLMDKLSKLDTEELKNQQRAIQQAQSQLTNLSESYNTFTKDSAMQEQEISQTRAIKNSQITQQIMSAQQTLGQAQNRASVATNRISCSGKASSLSQSSLDRLGEGYASVPSMGSRVESLCNQLIVCVTPEKWEKEGVAECNDVAWSSDDRNGRAKKGNVPKPGARPVKVVQ